MNITAWIHRKTAILRACVMFRTKQRLHTAFDSIRSVPALTNKEQSPQ
ncbi:MAG: hypothetical protein WCF30_20435 [Terracidiphilus sp.]